MTGADIVGATPYGAVDPNGLWRWIHCLVGTHEEYGQDGMPEVTSIVYYHMLALLHMPTSRCIRS